MVDTRYCYVELRDSSADHSLRRSEMAQRLCGRRPLGGEFFNVTGSYAGKGIVRNVW